MTVDDYVVLASTSRELPSLRELLEVMTEYVTGLEEAGLDPLQDPAVLVLGSYVSFHTHSDINTVGGYRVLIQKCQDRIYAREQEKAGQH